MPTRSDVKAGRVKPIVLTHTEPPVIVPPTLQINELDLHDMQESKLTKGHPLLNADEIERLYGSPLQVGPDSATLVTQEETNNAR